MNFEEEHGQWWAIMFAKRRKCTTCGHLFLTWKQGRWAVCRVEDRTGDLIEERGFKLDASGNATEKPYEYLKSYECYQGHKRDREEKK